MSLENPTSVDANGIAQWGTHEGQQIVTFYKGARHNVTKSRETGVPVYDDIDMVRVITPGDNDGNGIEVEARPEHKFRYARQWAAYQKNQDQRAPGTPLVMLFPDSPATVKTLNAKSIYTVQQLAGLDDSIIINNPMFRQLKTRAGQWLQTALKGAEDHKLKAENEALKGDLDNARSDIKQLKKQVEMLMNADKPKGKPGRPKKVAAPEPEPEETGNPFDPENYESGDK